MLTDSLDSLIAVRRAYVAQLQPDEQNHSEMSHRTSSYQTGPYAGSPGSGCRKRVGSAMVAV